MNRTPFDPHSAAAVIHTHAHDVHVDSPLSSHVLVGGFIPAERYEALGVPAGAPVPGSLWRHWKDRPYMVLGVVPSQQPKGSADSDFGVVYLGVNAGGVSGRVWLRRLTGEDGWLTPPTNVPADLTEPTSRFRSISLGVAGAPGMPFYPNQEVVKLLPPRQRPSEDADTYNTRLFRWVRAVASQAMLRSQSGSAFVGDAIIRQVEIAVGIAHAEAMRTWRAQRDHGE